jgi:hypothetical protein
LYLLNLCIENDFAIIINCSIHLAIKIRNFTKVNFSGKAKQFI